MWLTLGGFLCGFIAGAAAQNGRLCTMTAVEDAIVSRDFRAVKAWGLALGVAIVLTQSVARLLDLDLAASVYASGPIDLGGALLGGILFGLGMALVGTCSFGLLVRTGSGDLRAVVSAAVVGIAAFAFTGGVLAPIRSSLTGLASLTGAVVADPSLLGGPLLPGIARKALGGDNLVHQVAWPMGLCVLLLALALFDKRLRRRPRQLASAALIGGAVALGWAITGMAVNAFETTRLESLSFVAPVGRLLLRIMSDGLREVGFGVASVVGVVCGALLVALIKREVRREAFDDFREMRRHLIGAILMGCGGVLARGCTIGQGLSAASALAVTAPVVIIGVLIGARIGLLILLEGRELWSRLRTTARRA